MKEKKKVNIVVSIIFLTILNFALISIFFFVLTLIAGLIFSKIELSEGLYTAVSLFVIILSFVLAFIVYKKILVLLSRKWEIEKKENK